MPGLNSPDIASVPEPKVKKFIVGPVPIRAENPYYMLFRRLSKERNSGVSINYTGPVYSKGGGKELNLPGWGTVYSTGSLNLEKASHSPEIRILGDIEARSLGDARAMDDPTPLLNIEKEIHSTSWDETTKDRVRSMSMSVKAELMRRQSGKVKNKAGMTYDPVAEKERQELNAEALAAENEAKKLDPRHYFPGVNIDLISSLVDEVIERKFGFKPQKPTVIAGQNNLSGVEGAMTANVPAKENKSLLSSVRSKLAGIGTSRSKNEDAASSTPTFDPNNPYGLEPTPSVETKLPPKAK